MHCSGSIWGEAPTLPLTCPFAVWRGGCRRRNHTERAAVCHSSGMLRALLRQYVRPYRGLVAVVMVLQLISTLASLYLPTVNAAIIYLGVAVGSTGTIIRLGGVMLVVTAAQVVCAIGAVYFG